jgi:activating signal cointegrator 1
MGIKTIETRSWATSYRGDLLIHASMSKKAALITGEDPFKKYIPDFRALSFGSIIGKVVLVDVLPTGSLHYSASHINRLTMEERIFGDYSANRWAWILEDPVEFEKPIPYKGTLGLWEAGIDL